VKTDIGNFVYRGSSEDEEGDVQLCLDQRDQIKVYPQAIAATVEEEPNGVSLHLMEEEAEIIAFAVASVLPSSQFQLGGRDLNYWLSRIRKALEEAGADYRKFYSDKTEFQALARQSEGIVYLGTLPEQRPTFNRIAELKSHPGRWRGEVLPEHESRPAAHGYYRSSDRNIER
jgi:hypothetical protein